MYVFQRLRACLYIVLELSLGILPWTKYRDIHKLDPRRNSGKGFRRRIFDEKETHWHIRLKSCKDHRKKVTNFQISLENEDLFHNIPEELKDLQYIFEEIENLEFEDRPDYEKVITFIKNHEHFGKAEWAKQHTRSFYTVSHITIPSSKSSLF